MTTIEILSAFMKGNEVASISIKQRDWLLSQAKRENIKTHFDGFSTHIYLSDCHYSISSAQGRRGGYGGTIVHYTISGKFNLKKFYSIKFESTGLTQVCTNTDMDYYKREGHKFTIINQL
jgi:hypothetical protein